MKKSLVLIITLLLVIPLTVSAADVKTLDSTVEGKTIKFSGTTEDGITAVMCHLYDASDADVDKLSYPVDANAFDGEFTVTDDGEYKVSCARYEGGETTVSEVTVGDVQVTPTSNTEEETADKDTSKGNAVKTYDAIKTYVTLAAGAILIIAGSVLVIKRKKVKNN